MMPREPLVCWGISVDLDSSQSCPLQDSVSFQDSVSSRPYTLRLGVPVTQLIARVKVNRQSGITDLQLRYQVIPEA